MSFLRGPNGITRLDRLDDGRVMCCLCFGFFAVEQLHITSDGRPEDVCVDCAEMEERHAPVDQRHDEHPSTQPSEADAGR